jgi:hypothetical protein
MMTSTPRPLLPLLLLLLVSSTFFSLLTAHLSFDLTQISITSITSDGACIDQFPYALNCSLPATLTLHLSGLLLTVRPFSNFPVVIDGGDSEWFLDVDSSPNDTNTVVGELRFSGYTLPLMGRMLTVALYDYATGNRSQPFNGLSLLPLPPPVLTSISGCEGSGLSTLNCLPDRDVLTFQGSGLSIFRELYSFTLNIGQSSGTVFYNGGMQVVNDNTMLITLNTSYSVYADASHYTGVKLPISFNLAWYSVSSKLYQYQSTLTCPSPSFPSLLLPSPPSSHPSGTPLNAKPPTLPPSSAVDRRAVTSSSTATTSTQPSSHCRLRVEAHSLVTTTPSLS